MDPTFTKGSYWQEPYHLPEIKPPSDITFDMEQLSAGLANFVSLKTYRP